MLGTDRNRNFVAYLNFILHTFKTFDAISHGFIQKMKQRQFGNDDIIFKPHFSFLHSAGFIRKNMMPNATISACNYSVGAISQTFIIVPNHLHFISFHLHEKNRIERSNSSARPCINYSKMEDH